MSQIISCDLAIIGAGAGGLSLAAGAAQLGNKVVLIEANQMGGDCLNYGCVPSKSLLAAAKAAWNMQEATALGITTESIKINFSKVMQHVHNVIHTIAKNDSVERFESLGVVVLHASAHFINPHTLQVDDNKIKARNFVIATGSTPFVPPIPGLDKVHYYTNETIFNLTEQPQHLLVIGGGPIGCELAQAFAMLGSQVTILEGIKILPKDEPDCVAVIKNQFSQMNIAMHEGIQIKQIMKSNDQITVLGEENGKEIRITGSHLLVATGRRAQVHNLNLENAGVSYSPKGIQVDQRLRTTNKRIYALGDVTGDLQFTHMANYHASIVLKNILFKWPAKVDHHAIPWVTYTEPEMAHVGMLAADAEKKFKADTIKITEWPFAENDRAQAELQTTGKIKIVTNTKGRILGVTIVGANAGDLLLPWVMAIREGKTLRSFTDAIIPYPTLSEISKQVASKFYSPLLFSNKVRRMVRLLQKLG